jgi:hypothetical protein
MSFLSSVLGLDASHNAGVAQNEADQAQTAATGYQQQASGLYNGLSTQGQQLEGQGQSQYSQYSNLINSLLPQYEGAAGINGANNPGGAAAPGGTAQPTNSFALNPDEQQQLNSQIDVINQQHQAAQQANNGAQAQRGFVDPSATQAQNQIIAEHFNQAVNDHTANFMQTARTNRISNIMNLLGFGAGEQGAGAGQQEAGMGVEGAAAGGVAGLAGQAEAMSANQATNANNLNKMANSQLGNAANFLTQAFGIGKGAKPAQPPGTGSDPGNSGSAPYDFAGAFAVGPPPAGSVNNWTAPGGPVSTPAPGASSGWAPSYLLSGVGTGGADAQDNANFNYINGD